MKYFNIYNLKNKDAFNTLKASMELSFKQSIFIPKNDCYTWDTLFYFTSPGNWASLKDAIKQIPNYSIYNGITLKLK